MGQKYSKLVMRWWLGQIYYLTYVSQMTLKAGITPKTLMDIGDTAKTQNMRFDVTGFLCFGNGYFFQYIEGEQQTIAQLFDNIQRDRRNRNVTLLTEGWIDQRLFQGWQMLMVNVNNPDTPDEIVRAFQPMAPNAPRREQAQALVELMRSQYHRHSLVDFDQYSYKNISYYGVRLRDLVKAHRNFLVVQAILLALILVSLSRLD